MEEIRRTEDAEGNGNLTGIPIVSTNLDSSELPVSKPSKKEHTWAGHGYICSKELPCLASVEGDRLGPVEA